MAAMKTLLAAICLLTLLAVAYLSASVLILRPPRANVGVWLTLASVFIAVGAFTLAALYVESLSAPLRYAVLTGGAVVTAVGAWMVRSTLTSVHFEGYQLVLGSMLVVQGALTLAAFVKPRATQLTPLNP
jgi:hypothetical protein